MREPFRVHDSFSSSFGRGVDGRCAAEVVCAAGGDGLRQVPVLEVRAGGDVSQAELIDDVLQAIQSSLHEMAMSPEELINHGLGVIWSLQC